MTIRIHLLTVLTICCLTVHGCGSPKDDLPNVILISLDTVRADHLGSYGYERNTSPNMDAFAETASLYTRAYTTAPWTLPTHTSMFTGRFPAEHGVRRYKTDPETIFTPAIPEDLTTLGEVFNELGYTSGAYAANQAFLGHQYGFARGFEYYKCQWMPAEPLMNRALRWLENLRDPERPFFMFLNFMDAHVPYNVEHCEGLLPEPPHQNNELLFELAREVLPGGRPLPEELRQRVIDQYDTGIANIDKQIGKLFAELKKRGEYEDTLIVITSDHGELFGEWDLVGHGKALYEPLIKAVLMVRMPGQTEGAVVDSHVSSVDIPRLILNGLPAEQRDPYEKVFPYAPGNHPIVAENHFSLDDYIFNPDYGDRFDRQKAMWFEWPWKYVHEWEGNHELYNLDDDPGEANNLIDVQRDRAAAMAKSLEDWRAERLVDLSDTAAPEMTQEDRDAMEALGYL